MRNLMLIALVICGLTSCEKWLEISPKSEIASNQLFQSEQGFKDALIGSYLLMSSRNSYGFESTIGFVDFLGQQYFVPGSTHPYYFASLYQYDHTSVIPRKDNIWANEYNVIANLNNLLENIDLKKEVLHPAHYAYIKGESLGLRAFLHFDLYRLFGYGAFVTDPSSLQKKVIPYVTKYSKQITPLITTTAYFDSLQHDLEQAAILLAPYDSSAVANNGKEVPNADLFYTDRKLRFNYYAVKATQARLYLWMGDYAKAIAAATEVITKCRKYPINFNNGNINDPNPVNKDYTFSTEHIFGLNVQNLYDIVRPYIQRYAADGSNINYSRFNHNGTTADNLYEIATRPGMSLSDYRYKELYNKVSTSDYLLLKFTFVENSGFKDRMPLIRLPEMYYILAEAYNELGDQATAIGYLNTVRINRGIASSFNLPATLNRDEVRVEIGREYRKEFVSEGQLFYYYKRIGATTIPGTSRAMNHNAYVLPLPEKELNMGGR